jgi:hypothetical protein
MIEGHKIIDNALPNLQFKKLKERFFKFSVGWFWLESSAYPGQVIDDYSYSFYNWILSPDGDFWEPNFSLCMSALHCALDDYYDDISVLRIRAGLHSANPTNIVDEPHVDIYQPHMVALLYLNDADGPTYLHNKKYVPEDGNQISLKDIDLSQSIKVMPKENRLLLFNGSIYHSSSKQTTPSRRIAINYNFTGKLKD